MSTCERRLRRAARSPGLEPSLELRDDPVHGGEVLERPRGQRAIDLVQRPLRRQLLGPLDLHALELAAQHRLEAAQDVARNALIGRLGRGLGARVGAQPERAADPLDVDADHA